MKAPCCHREVLMLHQNGLCPDCNREEEARLAEVAARKPAARKPRKTEANPKGLTHYERNKEHYKEKAKRWKEENPELVKRSQETFRLKARLATCTKREHAQQSRIKNLMNQVAYYKKRASKYKAEVKELKKSLATVNK